MIRFELDPFAGPGDASAPSGPGPDFLACLDERETRIATCAARPGGHRWRLVGTPEETPDLECEDCPAGVDDLAPDCLYLLDAAEQELGGRTVVFGVELPADAEPYSIPVDVQVEYIVHPGGPWGATEYDIELHITDREATP